MDPQRKVVEKRFEEFSNLLLFCERAAAVLTSNRYQFSAADFEQFAFCTELDFTDSAAVSTQIVSSVSEMTTIFEAGSSATAVSPPCLRIIQLAATFATTSYTAISEQLLKLLSLVANSAVGLSIVIHSATLLDDVILPLFNQSRTLSATSSTLRAELYAFLRVIAVRFGAQFFGLPAHSGAVERICRELSIDLFEQKSVSIDDSTTFAACANFSIDLLFTAGYTLNSSIRRDLQSRVVRRCARAQDTHRLLFYRLLDALISAPDATVVPAIQCAAKLFASGRRHADLEVAEFCTRASVRCANLVRPQSASFVLYGGAVPVTPAVVNDGKIDNFAHDVEAEKIDYLSAVSASIGVERESSPHELTEREANSTQAVNVGQETAPERKRRRKKRKREAVAAVTVDDDVLVVEEIEAARFVGRTAVKDDDEKSIVFVTELCGESVTQVKDGEGDISESVQAMLADFVDA